MSDLNIALAIGIPFLVVFFIIGIVMLVNKFDCIERDIRNCERGIYRNGEKIFQLRMATKMVNNIKINEILLELMGKCGYKISDFQVRPNFELIKINTKGDKSYGERKETKLSRTKKKES